MKNYFSSTFASFLVVAITLPASFLATPGRVEAAGLGCVTGVAAGIASAITNKAFSVSTGDAPTSFASWTSAGANFDECINTLVLMPIARAAIKSVIHKMTASVVSYINGGNGSGQPSYVQNLPSHLQGVGDSVAGPFIIRIATNLNSVFGSAISTSLQRVYAQQTSMAGFYAANRDTLANFSPNPNAFLAGDWSKGGTGAWLALTTQPQNNPYMLYQSSLDRLGNNVAQAQNNRRQDIVQSGGFLSWCGGDSVRSNASGGVAPGASCINKDGSQAPVQTPGSVIHDYTRKAVVEAGFDEMYAQLISANDIDSALATITNAMISQVLSSSGLFGASYSSSGSGGSSMIDRLNTYSDSSVSATQNSAQTASSILSRVAAYKTAWETIATAANNASTSLSSLADFCTEAATANTANSSFVTAANAQATAARAAITSAVAPVLTDAQKAYAVATTTQAAATKVQEEALAGTNGSSSALSPDLAALTAMPPSLAEVADTQTSATPTNGARATPAGSLTVSGGTLVDRMNLLSKNADALKASACTVAPQFPWGGISI